MLQLWWIHKICQTFEMHQYICISIGKTNSSATRYYLIIEMVKTNSSATIFNMKNRSTEQNSHNKKGSRVKKSHCKKITANSQWKMHNVWMGPLKYNTGANQMRYCNEFVTSKTSRIRVMCVMTLTLGTLFWFNCPTVILRHSIAVMHAYCSKTIFHCKISIKAQGKSRLGGLPKHHGGGIDMKICLNWHFYYVGDTEGAVWLYSTRLLRLSQTSGWENLLLHVSVMRVSYISRQYCKVTLPCVCMTLHFVALKLFGL